FEQVGEADGLRVDVGVLVGEGDGDVQRVGPLHCASPYLLSETWLIVYFGISMVRSSSFTTAWHESRDCASRPQALSNKSSSFSSDGSRLSKPLRTTTWQVVHAHDFSQACSISM